MSAYVDYRLCSSPGPGVGGPDVPHVCERFSAYGWCPDGVKCSQSHNIDQILEEDEKCKEGKKKRRRKRKKAAGTEAQGGVDSEPPCKQSIGVPLNRSEPGALDSLMTNTVHCQTEGAKNLPEPPEKTPEKTPAPLSAAPLVQDSSPVDGAKPSASEGGTHRAGFDAFMTGYIMAYVCMLKAAGAACCLPDCVNKVYLSGKNVPLHIVKSVFSKSSRAHAQKMRLISSVGL